MLVIEFGEKLLYKVKPKDKMAKMEAQWEKGIFVGVRRRSAEIWIAVKGKIFGARAVRRLPEDERWSEDCVRWVDRVPWNRYKDCAGADGDLPEAVQMETPSAEAKRDGVEQKIVFLETRGRAPREFYIRKEDAERHGYTRGCPGCSSWHRGLGRQPHTEECRERFRELLKDEARVKNAKQRREDFEEKEREKKRRRQEKKGVKRHLREQEDREGNEEMHKKARQETSDASSGSSLERGVKREHEDEGGGETEMAVGSIAREALVEIERWVCEIRLEVEQEMIQEEEGAECDHSWMVDDVSGGWLSADEVEAARAEEVGFMQRRKIWSVRSVEECWSRTGKAPVSVR